MTMATIKSEEKRLDSSANAGAKWVKTRINPAVETKNRIQFARHTPDTPHGASERLDQHVKRRQGQREGVLLGECRIKYLG